MAAIVLGFIALVAVILSFGLAALVVTISHRREATPREEPDDQGSPAETMSRVLGEVERLASLKERGVLTAKEFTAQKTKLLQDR